RCPPRTPISFNHDPVAECPPGIPILKPSYIWVGDKGQRVSAVQAETLRPIPSLYLRCPEYSLSRIRTGWDYWKKYNNPATYEAMLQEA
ncbi:hypothetical protein F4604DRAFT_1775612, partial [Suillus subluteus]